MVAIRSPMPIPRPLLKLVALLAVTSLGAAPGRRGAAAPAATSLAPVTRRVLPNGLTVLVQERHTAPVVTTMMWYRVGSRDEIPGSTGLAHFLEHMMFKGTRRIGKGMIDRLTYQNGGINDAFTSDDYTAYRFDFPSNRWKIALRIEADRMRNLLIDPRELEAERKVVMEERRQGEDDPPSQLYEQLKGVCFLAHPYRNPTIGWMPDLRRATRREVVEFYNRFYVPANAALVIAGDVRTADALRSAETAFAGVPRLPAPRHRQVIEPTQAAQRRVDLALPANLPRLEMMFHVPQRGNPDLYPLDVLQFVLSDGKICRLYQRLVERDRIAAEVAASVDASRDPGQMFVSVELKTGQDPSRAENAVWDEFRRLGEEPITERELQKAKNAIRSQLIHGRETAQQAATEIGEAEAIGGYEYLISYAAKIGQVTTADVQRVARQYLRPSRASIGHLLPKTDESGRALAARAPRLATGRRIVGRTVAPRYPRPRGKRRLPAGVETPVFPPLRVTEQTLPNGLRLLLLENHDLPSITLTAQVRTGSRDDTDQAAGLANFTGRTLEEGTRSFTHRQISETLEFVGAGYGASVGRNSTSVSLTSLSDHTRSLLPYFAEMLTAPTFPQERADLERTQILADIQASDEEPGSVATRLFYEKVYGSHPHHRPVIGYASTVKQITPDQLRRFHETWYVPAATTIAVVGDFRTHEMLADLTRLFTGWAARPAPLRTAAEAPELSTTVRARQTMEKAQTHIVLGHPGISRLDPDFVPLLVMDSILGEGVAGGFTARIPFQLRDVQGLAYSVGSSITASATSDPGVFVAQMGTEPRNEAKAIPALLAEIRRIRDEPVTQRELYEAVNYLISSYVFAFQTNEQLAAYLLTTDYYRLGFDYRQRYPKLLQRVTREDVERVARRHLRPDRYVLVVVGPDQKP